MILIKDDTNTWKLKMILIKDDTNIWKDTMWSQTGRFNVVKISTFPRGSQVQCNPYENLNGIFCGTRKIQPKIDGISRDTI